MNIKSLFFAAFMLCTASVVSAQNENYSRVHASFNFGGTDIERTGVLNNGFVNALLNEYVGGIDKISTYGFSAGYTYGINIKKSLPLFIEIGGELNYVGGTSTATVKYGEKNVYDSDIKLRMMNLQIPINVIYRIPVDKGFDITPYAGINLKINLTGDLEIEDEECNLFDGDDISRLCYSYVDKFIPVVQDIDDTANRLQLGLNFGVNFIIAKKYSIGYRFMTDVTKYYSMEKVVAKNHSYGKEKVYTAGFRIKPVNNHYITFGYIF